MKLLCLRAGAPFAALAALALSTPPLRSMPVHNVPNGAVIGRYESRVDPAKEMNLTIVLKMHGQAEFDGVLEELYDPASPRYQHWLTDEDLAKYAPTAQEFATLKNELIRQGFTIVSEHPQRLSIRVHGTAATIEKAFHTELAMFSYNGRTFQAHTRDAHLEGPAGGLIGGISGLERHDARPMWRVARNPLTGQALMKKRLNGKGDSIPFLFPYTNSPLAQSATKNFGASPLTASYTGYQYGANGEVGGLAPADLQSHYGVPFTQGSKKYDGTGQTIALVDAYGGQTIAADAKAAASMFKLPALTSSNFSIIGAEGQKVNTALDSLQAFLTGWDIEIALDVQVAHALAPGAKIDLVISPGQDNEDMLFALSYVITNKLANTVSNSWGEDLEVLSGPLEEEAFNAVMKTGASKGISIHFASGDDGDNGLGTPEGTVGVPANSPYVTAVGGTSILNNPYGTGQIVTGWGSNDVFVYDQGVVDPLEGVFSGGAGGGESLLYPSPKWQNSLKSSWRMIPDVSAVADPATGFPVVATQEGVQYGQIVGGTSLATPLFSAIWAVADQYNGGTLGQAATYLQKLTSAEITDVVPPATAHDVTGTIKDKKGTHTYTATTIFTDAADANNPGSTLSLYGQNGFLSALLPEAGSGNEFYFVASFGTDTSLTVTPGWDDVTGWGEPNGVNFVQGVTGKLTGTVD